MILGPEHDPRPIVAPYAPDLPPGWTFSGLEEWPPQPHIAGFMVGNQDDRYCADAEAPGCLVSAWAATPAGAIAKLEQHLRAHR